MFDLGDSYVIDPAEFQSMGRATPFEGWAIQGECKATLFNGTIAYQCIK